MNQRSPLVSSRNLLLVVGALMALVLVSATVTALLSHSASAKQTPTCAAYKCNAGGGDGADPGDPSPAGDPGKSGEHNRAPEGGPPAVNNAAPKGGPQETGPDTADTDTADNNAVPKGGPQSAE
jgi:hypothetical protein